MTFKVYIPARYASSRLPGKPLLQIAGKSLLQRVYDNALNSGATEVVIATDDERIASAAIGFGATVAMTDPALASGTDRIAAAVRQRDEPADSVIVNVQSDEPELPAVVIRQVAAMIRGDRGIDIATVCEPIETPADLDDPNIVKVTRDDAGNALYFSRAKIPFPRSIESATEGEGLLNALATYRRHVGIYAYTAGYLARFVALEPAAIERLECLEQLRALANGHTIAVHDASADCGLGIDTPADLERARQLFGAR
jgi:3-deoxy-manno-octulosonate cytidylyltransferase (CMP-KDO synthetase)